LRAVALALNNLAVLYHKKGKYAQAEPLYKRALGIWENKLGYNHPKLKTIVKSIEILYIDLGKPDQAKVYKDRHDQMK